MGWSFLSSCRSKKAIIDHLTIGNGVKTLAKCIKGNVLWTVQESKSQPGKNFIGCYLLGVDQGWWGYKDMDESCGPIDITCPLSYLAMVPDPGGYATAWRERVKYHHEKLAQFNGMKPGTKVMLRPGLTIRGTPITEDTVRPLRAKVGFLTVRLSKKHIESILPA